MHKFASLVSHATHALDFDPRMTTPPPNPRSTKDRNNRFEDVRMQQLKHVMTLLAEVPSWCPEVDDSWPRLVVGDYNSEPGLPMHTFMITESLGSDS